MSRRIIHLEAEDTKELRRKRVPIHLDLLPILEKVMSGRTNATELIFSGNGQALTKGSGRRVWEKAVKQLVPQALSGSMT